MRSKRWIKLTQKKIERPRDHWKRKENITEGLGLSRISLLGLTPHPQQQEFVPFSFEFLFGELWISVEPVKEGLLVLALLERTENLMDSFGAPIRDLQQDYKKEN